MSQLGDLIVPSLWGCDGVRIRSYLEIAQGLPARALVLPLAREQIDQLLREIPTALRPRIRVLPLKQRQRARSVAINLALAVASADKVAVIDDDIVLSKAAMRALWHSCTARSFATVRRVRSGARRSAPLDSEIASVSHEIRFKPRGSPSVHVETSRYDLRLRGTSAPGAICVTRRAFRAVGGMNGALMSSAWEMVDLLVRLQIGAGLRRVQTGSARLAETAEPPPDPSAQQQSAAAYAVASEASIAEYWQGRFKGTFTEDVRRTATHVIRWTPRLGWARQKVSVR